MPEPAEQAFYADSVLYARVLRRRVFWWRVAAALLLVGLIIVASRGDESSWRGDHIARIHVEGVIFSNQELLDRLDHIAQADDAKALIVVINSPGGTGAASEALYHAVRDVAAQKPVVAVMAEIATSGGYIAALGSDHILARSTSITGSIGMIFQWAEMEELFDWVGVDFPAVRSGPYKARPAFNEKASDEVLAVSEELVQDGFRWFVDLVAERRAFEPEEALKLADGRVYSGRQALTHRLIDALGGEKEAQAWLAEKDGALEDLPVFDYEKEDWFFSSVRQMDSLAGFLTGTLPQARNLGLAALWQPGR